MATITGMSIYHFSKETLAESKVKKIKINIKEGGYDVIMGDPNGKNKVKAIAKLEQMNDRVKITIIYGESKYIMTGRYDYKYEFIRGRFFNRHKRNRAGDFIFLQINEHCIRGVIRIKDKDKCVVHGKSIVMTPTITLKIREKDGKDKTSIRRIYEEEYQKEMKDSFLNDSISFKVAESGGNVIGFIKGELLTKQNIGDYFKTEMLDGVLTNEIESKLEKERLGFIKKMAIDKDHLESGLATNLIKATMRDFVFYGIDTIFIKTYKTEAEILWENLLLSLGFKLYADITNKKFKSIDKDTKDAVLYVYGV